MIDSKETLVNMLEAGVEGYILKDIDIKDLMRAIELVLDGHMFITPQIEVEYKEHLLNKSRYMNSVKKANLSAREIEVLKLICAKLTSTQIAEKLFLSSKTINNHRSSMLKKTDTENVAGLILYAIRTGFFYP